MSCSAYVPVRVHGCYSTSTSTRLRVRVRAPSWYDRTSTVRVPYGTVQVLYEYRYSLVARVCHEPSTHATLMLPGVPAMTRKDYTRTTLYPYWIVLPFVMNLLSHYTPMLLRAGLLPECTSSRSRRFTTVRVPTQGEETRYKKVPYLSKASFRRINTGYYPKLRKWLPVGQKSLPLPVS